MQLLLVAACVVLAAHVSEGLGFGGGSSCGCPAPAPPPPPPPCPPPPVQNQCCSAPLPPQAPQCGCKTRRRVTRRRQTRDVTHDITLMNDSTDDDPYCNSKELRQIILNVSRHYISLLTRTALHLCISRRGTNDIAIAPHKFVILTVINDVEDGLQHFYDINPKKVQFGALLKAISVEIAARSLNERPRIS